MICISRLTFTAAALAAMAALPPAMTAQQDPARPEVIVHGGDPPRVELRGGMTVPIREFVANPEGPFVRGILGPGLPSPGPPKGVDPLGWLVQQAELVVVVDVVAGSPRLNDRGDFVVSDWRARMTRVFKRPDDSWTTGQEVGFTTRGGTMMVAGTVVDAFLPWERPVRVSNRYLVFGHESANKGREELRQISQDYWYEFVGLNTIRRVCRHCFGDALEMSFQAEVVTRLEELTGAR